MKYSWTCPGSVTVCRLARVRQGDRGQKLAELRLTMVQADRAQFLGVCQAERDHLLQPERTLNQQVELGALRSDHRDQITFDPAHLLPHDPLAPGGRLGADYGAMTVLVRLAETIDPAVV